MVEIVSLPIEIDFLGEIDVPDLPETNCPVTPYDRKIHGYMVKEHEDWLAKGAFLINLIVDCYLDKQ